MTKEEYQKIVEIYGKNFDWLDIPTFIRRKDEAEQLALEQQEEEWRQEQKNEERRQEEDVRKI